MLVGFPGGLCLLCYVEFVYVYRSNVNRIGLVLWAARVVGWSLVALGMGSGVLPIYWDYDATYGNQERPSHSWKIVPRKHLTGNSYWGTVIDMANVLNADKQIAVIGALAEGSSIRSIERITGVHRDTIMRLGVKVGEGCARMLDTSMRNLP